MAIGETYLRPLGQHTLHFLSVPDQHTRLMPLFFERF